MNVAEPFFGQWKTQTTRQPESTSQVRPTSTTTLLHELGQDGGGGPGADIRRPVEPLHHEVGGGS